MRCISKSSCLYIWYCSPQPSEIPSVSDWPTSQPSRNPSISGEPSSIPSESPSVSAKPSSQPSENPSISDRPTSQPSMNPSISGAPSSQVSNIKHILALCSYLYSLDTKVVIHISHISLITTNTTSHHYSFILMCRHHSHPWILVCQHTRHFSLLRWIHFIVAPQTHHPQTISR